MKMKKPMHGRKGNEKGTKNRNDDGEIKRMRQSYDTGINISQQITAFSKHINSIYSSLLISVV